MNKRVNIERNRVFHLEDSMIMYGVYNVDTLEKLIQMVHKMNNRSVWYEKLYAGQVNKWLEMYLASQGAKLLCHTFNTIFMNYSRKIYKNV